MPKTLTCKKSPTKATVKALFKDHNVVNILTCSC